MAYVQVNFYAEQLKRNVTFSALIPNDVPKAFRGEQFNTPMKTLYLLPGYSGNYHDWMINAALQDLSNQYHLAIISVAGENSFYLDHKAEGFKYGAYVGEELVAYTRELFGLSDKREDTYIGGFSMGGFGAIRNGLKYHETFSKVVALSSALITREVSKMQPGSHNGMANYEYYEMVFGETAHVLETENDPEYLVKTLMAKGEKLPEIYMACGSEDFLIEPNRAFANFLKEQKAPAVYEEAPGVHDWNFWKPYIERGIKWIMEE